MTFLKWIARHPEEMQKLGYRPYKSGAIVYILGVEKKYSVDELIQTMVNIVPEIKEDIMTAAQQLEQRGMQQGIQKGMQQGIQKGIQKGMQQGMQQGMQVKSVEIAKNMLSKLHLDMQIVAQATGLSEEELMKLQQEGKESN